MKKRSVLTWNLVFYGIPIFFVVSALWDWMVNDFSRIRLYIILGSVAWLIILGLVKRGTGKQLAKHVAGQFG